MKRTLLSLARNSLRFGFSAVVLAALFAGCDTTNTPEPNPTDAYVPLAQGNEWDYVWDLPDDGDSLNWNVLGSEDGAWRVELNLGDTTEEWLWRHTADGEFQAKPADEENWRTYLKMPIEVGTEWTFTDDAGVLWEGRIGATDSFFDTPAGYFDELVWVAIYEYGRTDNYDYNENYWFKEGVGVVRVAIDDDDRDQESNWRWLLNYYSLK